MLLAVACSMHQVRACGIPGLVLMESRAGPGQFEKDKKKRKRELFGGLVRSVSQQTW